MKVAAYQAPLEAMSSTKVLDLIRKQVAFCESHGVEILCCPEGVLGGLADYAASPVDIAIDVESGQLQSLLSSIASDTVTTILGFTEIDRSGELYNSATVFHRGRVVGLYHKLHPAINKSVFQAGDKTPVFAIGGLTFGILLCRDSNYRKPASVMASQGATALFIPTNNGLPPARSGPEVVAAARKADSARARENGVYVIRADVAGRNESLMSYGSSGITDSAGQLINSARQFEEDLVLAEIENTKHSSGVPAPTPSSS